MEVNGLPLPATLVLIVEEAQGRAIYWMFKEVVMREQIDAYCASLDIFGYRTMEQETDDLPDRFGAMDEGDPGSESDSPGFIPYIHDYSQVLAFGKVATGAPFCPDYRDNLAEPKVIFREATHWRRVAPTFDMFLGMIEPYDDTEFERRMREVYR